MVHTAVVLPHFLLERLRTDAAASRVGLSAKIRERLQSAYEVTLLKLPEEPSDPETNQLLRAIKKLSENLARDMGAKWHQHPYALAAFKAGVEAFLAQYHQEGDEKVRPNTHGAEPNDPPDIVGRTHARLIGIANHEGRGA